MQSTHDRDATEGIVDANYARNVDIKKSLYEYVFTLFGFSFYWKFSFQLVVVLSNTQVEYIVHIMGKGCTIIEWVIGELGIVQNCVTIHCNNQSVMHIVDHQVYHERTKIIYIRPHFLR